MAGERRERVEFFCLGNFSRLFECLVGNLFLRHSDFVIFLIIRSIRGIRGRLIPHQLVSIRIHSWLSTSFRPQKIFENFAPPFPEKELRDGTPRKVKKIIIDFICEQ